MWPRSFMKDLLSVFLAFKTNIKYGHDHGNGDKKLEPRMILMYIFGDMELKNERMSVNKTTVSFKIKINSAAVILSFIKRLAHICSFIVKIHEDLVISFSKFFLKNLFIFKS